MPTPDEIIIAINERTAARAAALDAANQIEAEIRDLKGQLDPAFAELENLRARAAAAEASLTQERATLDAARTAVQAERAALVQASTDLALERTQVRAEFQAQLDARDGVIADLDAQVKDLQAQLEAAIKQPAPEPVPIP